MKIFIYELFQVKNAINCKYWSNSIDYRNIRVNWGKTSLDISAWFFYFFSIKLFDWVKIRIFSNRLNQWTHIYLKFSKLVLLFKIDTQKVAKNGAGHRRFWKKCIFYYHELYWSELLNGLPWWSMCMRDSWAKSSLVFKKKIQEILNILKMMISLLKWGKTSLDYPYVIIKRTSEVGFHLNIECIVYFSKVVFFLLLQYHLFDPGLMFHQRPIAHTVDCILTTVFAVILMWILLK